MNPSLEPLWLSIAVLGMFALLWGAWRLRLQDRTKAVLMVICTLVILANLLILSI